MRARMRRRMWHLPLRMRWCILMILERRARQINTFPMRTLNLLASRRRRALVPLARGLRNRKTLSRAFCHGYVHGSCAALCEAGCRDQRLSELGDFLLAVHAVEMAIATCGDEGGEEDCEVVARVDER